jgi:drug/metabolite transporter (DMT)-like permease
MIANIVMLVGAGVSYGLIFPVNRMAAEAGWPPVSFAFFQALVAFAVIAAYVLARGGQLVPSTRHAVAFLVLGALAIGLPVGLLAKAASHVPASTLTLILALSPVFTLAFATLLRLEAFRARTLLAVFLGLCGVALIAWPGSKGLEAGATGWFLLALLAPVMFAACNVAASILRPPATTTATMASGMLGGAAIVAAPVALLADPALLPPSLWGAALLPLLIAAAVNIVFFLLYFEIVRRAGPTFMSTFNYVAIVAGIAWSMLLFREHPPAVFWIALLLMLASVFVAVSRRPPPQPA